MLSISLQNQIQCNHLAFLIAVLYTFDTSSQAECTPKLFALLKAVLHSLFWLLSSLDQQGGLCFTFSFCFGHANFNALVQMSVNM